jgi:hypothetical protein
MSSPVGSYHLTAKEKRALDVVAFPEHYYFEVKKQHE